MIVEHGPQPPRGGVTTLMHVGDEEVVEVENKIEQSDPAWVKPLALVGFAISAYDVFSTKKVSALSMAGFTISAILFLRGKK